MAESRNSLEMAKHSLLHGATEQDEAGAIQQPARGEHFILQTYCASLHSRKLFWPCASCGAPGQIRGKHASLLVSVCEMCKAAHLPRELRLPLGDAVVDVLPVAGLARLPGTGAGGYPELLYGRHSVRRRDVSREGPRGGRRRGAGLLQRRDPLDDELLRVGDGGGLPVHVDLPLIGAWHAFAVDEESCAGGLRRRSGPLRLIRG